jgi:hypothetical protein
MCISTMWDCISKLPSDDLEGFLQPGDIIACFFCLMCVVGMQPWASALPLSSPQPTSWYQEIFDAISRL